MAEFIKRKADAIGQIAWLLANEGNDILPAIGLEHELSKQLVEVVGRLKVMQHQLERIKLQEVKS